MVIFCAGAESAKYQEALLRAGGQSLQTFFAQRSIHEILKMKESIYVEEVRNDLPVRTDPRTQR